MIHEMANKRKINPFIREIVGNNKVYDTSKMFTKEFTYEGKMYEANMVPDEQHTFLYTKVYMGVRKSEWICRIDKKVIEKDFFSKMTDKQLQKYKKRSMDHFKKEIARGFIFTDLKIEDYKDETWIKKTLDSVPRIDLHIWSPYNVMSENTNEDVKASIFLTDNGKISRDRTFHVSHSERSQLLAQKMGISIKEFKEQNKEEVVRNVQAFAIIKGELTCKI